MTRAMSRVPGLLAGSLIRAVGDRIASRAKGGGRLCIVNYHRILSAPDPLLKGEPNIDTFRWQMDLLAECFNVLPLREAIRMLATERMPPRAVAITFDDGYRSIHDLALPLLIERGLPATVFVTTGHMHDESSMWNDVILEAIRRLPDTPLDLSELGLPVYPMRSAEDRNRTGSQVVEHCKYMPPEGRLRLTNCLQRMVGSSLRQDLMLTADMLRTLTRHQIEIGGHTVNHPILTQLDDETATHEIVENKRQLEAIIGSPLHLFAYPNGKRAVDYNERHIRIVADAGYTAAFTTETGAATSRDSLYEIPRSRPWDTTPLMFSGRLLRWLHGNNS